MKKVFEHADFSRVGLCQALLEEAGIETLIKNQHGLNATRKIPIGAMSPELWVLEEADSVRAEELLNAYRGGVQEIGSDWKCPSCGEEVTGEFSERWNCQTSRPS